MNNPRTAFTTHAKATTDLVLVLALYVLPSINEAVAETPKEVARKAFPAVVLITIQDKDGLPLCIGSGFFVAKDLVATNYHVIAPRGADRGFVRIVGGKKTQPIKGKVAVNPQQDLALLLIDKPESHESLPLANDNLPEVGEAVFAVGNPEGLEGTFSQGIVSGIRKHKDCTLIQLTAPISFGSSGGPVLNEKAEVIGVAVGMWREGQNLNFAVPSRYLKALLTKREKAYPLHSFSRDELLAAGGVVVAPAPGTPKQPASQPDSLLAELDEYESRSGWHAPSDEDAVKVHAFVWGSNGCFSFSVKNQHVKPLSFVRILVIFREPFGEQIDSREVLVTKPIPPGLAVRESGCTTLDVHSLVVVDEWDGKGRIEFRVLSFKVAE